MQDQMMNGGNVILEDLKKSHPDKFASLAQIFGRIQPGNHIFIGTGCGEPQYLVRELIAYVRAHPKAFFDAEVLQVWNLGVTPYADDRFKDTLRCNSFFIGQNAREAVNRGVADYTPIFLSSVPGLFSSGRVPVDIALIQTSLPDAHGYVSLGVSVDIVKSAIENARTVIAQVNTHMPRVHGESFIPVASLDYIVPHDELLLEFETTVADYIAERIGRYVSRIVQDGDTIQVGYGSIPNAILAHLGDRKDLGVHTELMTDGIAALMRKGVVSNGRKELNRGKTVAAFCMGKADTYAFIHDNPSVEFRPVNYTNNPLVIARNPRMTAINSALEIDLTGQATAESLGRYFFSGIGGQADFMRGAMLSAGGKTILTLESTADDGALSRIVPTLREGAGVTLTRGDVHYVVTEYGIAYLHGKNIRERALDLIAVAHPKFRPWLLAQAKEMHLVFQDQAFIPGEQGEYPEYLESRKTTSAGLAVLLRPVRLNDEHLLKDFFYSLSQDSMYRRFVSTRMDMPHERLQRFTAIDYTREMVILAIVGEGGRDTIAGMGQYAINERTHTAEVAFAVRDALQGRGVGTELLSYLMLIAKRNGLHGLSAEVLADNARMIRLFERFGFRPEGRADAGLLSMRLIFSDV